MGRNNSSESRNSNDRKPRNKNSRRKRPGGNKKNFNNKNRRPKKLTPSRVIAKYQNCLEQYLTARRKYFDVHGHKNDQQVEKAKRVYAQALKALRDFENGLEEDWQKEVLRDFLAAYPEDRQFSSEHNLEPTGDSVSFVGEFEDPHLLPVQKSQAWAEDNEDSQGTIADYYAYKGITPPEEIEKDTSGEKSKQ